MEPIPVINITDLYHPPQDPGDNFDLVMPYALPEIDLRAVILDVTEAFRRPSTYDERTGYGDDTGPRDPGIIPVTQLNYIFDRNVPYGIGPFQQMRTPDDDMQDLPTFQQSGVDLILQTLMASEKKVEITVFGSARALAVAYNREPDLLRRKVARVHLCAGASEPHFLEWNVHLDPQAIVCLLQSDLPIDIYPCATGEGPFAYGRHNCFWRLPDLEFVRYMHPVLKRYLGYAIGRVERSDFLRALEEDLPKDVMARTYARVHNVWETAVWLNVSGRRLVLRRDDFFDIVAKGELEPGDAILPNSLIPCSVKVGPDGRFHWERTSEPTSFRMYDRKDPALNERALRQALPNLYISFQPGSHMDAYFSGALG